MSKSIPPEIELFIERKSKEDDKRYDGIFASIWVEKVLTWATYLVGGMILTAIVLSATAYIK